MHAPPRRLTLPPNEPSTHPHIPSLLPRLARRSAWAGASCGWACPRCWCMLWTAAHRSTGSARRSCWCAQPRMNRVADPCFACVRLRADAPVAFPFTNAVCVLGCCPPRLPRSLSPLAATLGHGRRVHRAAGWHRREHLHRDPGKQGPSALSPARSPDTRSACTLPPLRQTCRRAAPPLLLSRLSPSRLQARHSYFPSDVRWQQAFEPVITRRSTGALAVDYSHFDLTRLASGQLSEMGSVASRPPSALGGAASAPPTLGADQLPPTPTDV